MADVVIRQGEGDDPFVIPSWDTVWLTDLLGSPSAGVGDWGLAAYDEEPRNRGGLTALDAIGTAIIQQIYSHRRMPDWMRGEDTSVDPGGWHGDTFDLRREDGERALGSLLYTLRRARVDTSGEFDTCQQAIIYARDALQTLIDQGIIGRLDIEAEIERPTGSQAILRLHIRAYDPVLDREVFANALPLMLS